MLSNILLTPFDKEMRRHGYQLTRWADDWVVTCRTRAEAQNVLARAEKILEELGVTLNREKTRFVHIAQGFEFLGFKIQRGKGQFKLAHDRIKSKLNRQNLYAIPTQKSVDRFKDQIRTSTKRRIPLRLGELINAINPIIRGWGHYYCRSQVRTRSSFPSFVRGTVFRISLTGNQTKSTRFFPVNCDLPGGSSQSPVQLLALRPPSPC